MEKEKRREGEKNDEKDFIGFVSSYYNSHHSTQHFCERRHRDRMERLGVDDLFDERENILVGTDYIAELFDKYEDTTTVLMVYHGEQNAVQKAENGEISEYAQGILDRSGELERLHGKEQKMEDLGKEKIKQLIGSMKEDELEVVASVMPSNIIAKEIYLRIENLEMRLELTRMALQSEKRREISLI